MKIKSLVMAAVLVTAIFACPLGDGFVKAQTTDNSAQIAQLQAMIQSLMQQIQALQAQQGGQSWCHTFNTNLGVGAVDANNDGNGDVASLQRALNFEKLPNVDGKIDGNYDEGVASLVIEFQTKYGITPKSGYAGPKTRAKLNSLYGCGTTPPPTCIPNWSCTSWSACTNNQQSRTCSDLNNCGQTDTNTPGGAEPIKLQTCNPSQPAITVTSPNGGETLTAGQTYQIKWSSTGLTNDPIGLFLINTNPAEQSSMPSGCIQQGVVASLVPYSANSSNARYVNSSCSGLPQNLSSTTNSYTWTVPTSLTGFSYYISVQQLIKGGGAIDNSNAPFTITAASNPSISSVNPQPAQVGSQLTVYISNGGNTGSVILKTTDGTKSWHIPYTTGTVYSGFIYYDGSKVTFTVPSTIGAGQLPENSGYEAPIPITSGTYNLFVYSTSMPMSNAFPITINVSSNVNQPIVLTNPAPGSSVVQGQKYNITWTGYDVGVTSYSVYLVGGSLGNTGSKYLGEANASQKSFSWTVPTDVTPGSGYNIDLSGAGATGNTVTANTSFSIVAPSTYGLDVLSSIKSSGGDMIFSFSRIASACLQIKNSRGEYFSLNTTNPLVSCARTTLMTGYALQLSVPKSYFTQSFVVGDYYQVCTYDTTGNNACSRPVKVEEVATQPAITVTSPKAGDSLVNGQSITIQWSGQNVSPNAVYNINIYNGGTGAMDMSPSKMVVSGLSSSTNSYTWTVQSNTGNNGYGLGMKKDNFWDNLAGLFGISKVYAAAINNQYVIQVCEYNTSGVGAGGVCGSSGMFTINACSNGAIQSCSSGTQTCVDGQWGMCVANNQNYVTVTSPNGGETWTQGQTYNINWTSSGLPSNANLYIALINDATGKQYGLTTTIGNTGNYAWTIPSTINYDSITGNKFKISITYSPSTTAYTDYSDNYFSIVAPIASCTPNWQCSAWNACTNSQQARTCSDLNNCGIITNEPALSQSCVVVNWTCSQWSACANNQQTRTCTTGSSSLDAAFANDPNKPALTQSCSSASSQPAISISGPASITAGQTGTWTINATDPNGTGLSYSVIWGDGTLSEAYSQNYARTHAFSNKGTYTANFYVKQGSPNQTGVQTSVSFSITVN